MSLTQAGRPGFVKHAADIRYTIMLVTIIHVQVPEDHLRELKLQAASNDRSVSAEVRRAIRLYVKQLAEQPEHAAA